MKALSPILTTLCACAAHSSDKTVFLNALSPDLNWQDFLNAADNHRVIPMVYANFKKWGFQSPVDDLLTKRFHATTKRALLQSALISEINTLLSEHQIPCIHFKGATLSALLYQNPALRQCKDIDFILQKTDFKKAYDILSKHGYAPVAPLFKKAYLNERYMAYRKDFYFTKQGCEIECHWSLTGVHDVFGQGDCFSQTASMTFNHCTLQTFEPNYYLAYLIYHGHISGWARLHWLTDVMDFINTQTIDWSIVKNHLNAAGHLQALFEANVLLSLFQTHIPEITQAPNSKMLKNTYALLNTPKTSGCLSRYNKLLAYRQLILLQSSKKQILQRTVKNLLISPKDWQLLKLPKPLFYLYFPLRPILWSIRMLSSAKNSARKSQAK